MVLAVGMVPARAAPRVSNLLKLSKSPDDFLLGGPPQAAARWTRRSDGIFLAGCCQGPKDIPDTVAQASGAAARACIPLSQGKVKTEAQVAQVDEKLCRACGFCMEVCPYEAIGLKRIEGAGTARDVAAVNEVLCKGCGACAAACLPGPYSKNPSPTNSCFR